ncbi:FG-GAP-like repeat-containing protein [Tautonia plasticadhaerens]|uniref:FG-GAP repeat protein n=1 Tax=Tautonia plasticadhaerens TaxID=2527974 RepID=A0A518HDQ2_9BACT|nr:FG-GAP-like repeat-containing protein [Tautonia plasticadhaerens]QDV38988.1 FG-GAP repeat protein [Tautonia plasticadhaerens]
MRRAVLAPAGVLAIVAASWAGWRWAEARSEARYQAGIAAAKEDVLGGSVASARLKLQDLADRWPGRGEAEFLLGACEQSLGRLDAARDAWARVPADSGFGPNAALMLARLALRGHRMAEAERVLPRAIGAKGAQGRQARGMLLRLYKLQGRYEEARRLVRDGGATDPDRVGMIRELFRLDSRDPMALGEHARAVEQAAAAAPDDPGVLLGLAHLAMRRGRVEEARRWLTARLERSDDPAAWRGWLDWALPSQDVPLARRALAHLPGGTVPPQEVLSLRAWFAARAGDAAAERAALSRLVELSPGSIPAVERLAGLARQAGDDEEAARLRSRKAELDRMMGRYVGLMSAPDPAGDAAELAAIAERLGRTFEARAWWELAVDRDPGLAADRAEASDRLARRENDRASADSLPRLLADLGPATDPTRTPADVPPRGPAPRFVDEAGPAGLSFAYRAGSTPDRQLPESMGSGVGLIDADGDGWLDVYLTQGGPFPPTPGDPGPGAGDRLFRNLGDGTFEDLTDAAGVADFARGYGHGVAVGDVDEDGDPDLFVTRYGSYALALNRGDGTFEDATEAWGLGGDRDWPTSAALADLDGDGDLDLYVCHYVAWDETDPVRCPDEGAGGYVLCSPLAVESRPDHLFRNDGGRFVDVTRGAGIVDEDGRGLGVVAADVDEDGLLDLYVANDQTANFLFRNLGGMRFEEVGAPAGVAAGGHGGYQAGMGVACGDLDGDGLPDLAVTNFFAEGTAVYRNLGRGIFADQSGPSGVLAATRPLLGFGLALVDVDNDGRLDLAQANGHVEDFRPESPYAMPALLMANLGGGRLADASAGAGPAWAVPRLARGLAAGDMDNDGRMDLLITQLDGPLAFLRNVTDGGRWLTIGLEGSAASGRDAVGARVAVEAGGRLLVRRRLGGGSYQSSGDPRIHVGLGDEAGADAVEVRWPSGRVDRFEALAAGAGYLLREGGPTPLPLPGFAPTGDADGAGPGG